MSTLLNWRTALADRLETLIPSAHVTITANAKGELRKNTWESPTIFVQLGPGNAGKNEVLSGVSQRFNSEVYILMAVRDLDLDSDSDITEHNEDMPRGIFDMFDVLTGPGGLSGFELTPSVKLFIKDWRPESDDSFSTVWRTTWQAIGAYITD